MALIPTPLRLRFLARDGLQLDDAGHEAIGELLRVSADDGAGNHDRRHETVTRSRHRRPLRVVPSKALVHVHLDIDLLARPHLRDQDVRVAWTNAVFPRKVLGLTSEHLARDVPRVQVRVMVQFSGVFGVRGRGPVVCADGFELEGDGVVVEGRVVGALALGRLAPEPHPLA